MKNVGSCSKLIEIRVPETIYDKICHLSANREISVNAIIMHFIVMNLSMYDFLNDDEEWFFMNLVYLVLCVLSLVCLII